MIVITCLVIFSSAASAGGGEKAGARSMAVGGASLTISDVWSGANNIAALAELRSAEIGAAYAHHFFLPGVLNASFASVFPLGGGSFALSAGSLGYHGYTDSHIGIGYGRSLSNVFDLGAQVNAIRLNIGPGYGSKTALVGSIGALFMPNEHLRLGVLVYNPTRTSLAAFGDERIPTRFSVGASRQGGDKVTLMAQLDKDLQYPINVSAGLEYQLLDQLLLRTGVSTKNRSFAFGVGLKRKAWALDLTQHWGQRLGFGAACSFGYRFSSKGRSK
ncbi:MAG: hypothetical protein HQ500_10630 [Flavobacteriales bacterium]|nr:hypothetical protein [Flavobacteriales bacterium]